MFPRSKGMGVEGRGGEGEVKSFGGNIGGGVDASVNSMFVIREISKYIISPRRNYKFHPHIAFKKSLNYSHFHEMCFVIVFF
jgi:hypothetical protein